MLSFTLLGQVTLCKNGRPLSRIRSQKEPALLIYLAQTGQTHPRDYIAELLWEGRSTQQARSNLRTALTRLRKQVGDALLITRQSLALAPESQQQVDAVNLLQTLAELGLVDSAAKANALQNTLDLYQGDFLADFVLPDAPQFEQWVLTTRERIRRQVVAAYDKLGPYALATGDVEYGINVARRWLQVDELDERAHTLLIRLLLDAGNVREAVTHYDACTNLLRAELSIEPPPAMTALIRNARPATRHSPLATRHSPPAPTRHNLPAEYDQFFGRQSAQQEIHARLDQSWCRLVTIMGQGGIGKTRLAVTIARGRLDRYADGVWLVELTEIDPDDDDLTEAMAVEIATALDLRLRGAAKPVAQLLDHLQHKNMLLVLDNFEHLLAGIPLILEIVQRCEQVQLLVTSREALGIRAEWTMALTGLAYPADGADGAAFADGTPPREEMSLEAVELFAARRAQQQWRGASADEQRAMRQICRLVEGLPLAIELAAALTRDASCRAIADQLHDGFDALAATLRDVPARHRSLHVVFEMSWRALTPALQARLARLALFRGGFTANAAQQIAAADAQDLDTLCAKSLVAQDEATGRYALHAVVRTYAAAKLSEASTSSATELSPSTSSGNVPVAEPAKTTETDSDQVLHKHAHYYLALLALHTEPLQKSAPQESVAVLHPDIDNVRLAWQTGLTFLAQTKGYVNQRSAADLLSSALTSLSIYYQLRGLAHEAEGVMQNTVQAATAWGAAGRALAARTGLEQARFQIRLGRYGPAMETVQATLRMAAQCADSWADGMGHVLWGEALWRLGEYEAAQGKLNHAHTIARTIDSTLLAGWCHHHLGVIDDLQSRYATAHEHLEQACAAWRTIGYVQALSGSLNSVGLTCYHQGNLLAAQSAMEEALTLCTQLDNRHQQSFLLNNLSIIAIKQGDYLNAHHYLTLGLKMAKANGDLPAQGLVYTNLGKNYRLMKKTGLAAHNLEEGLHISTSIGDRPLMAEAMIHLADFKRSQGDPTRAESLYSQALTITQQDNLYYTECEVLIGMAQLLSESNRSQARQYCTRAIELAKTIQNSDLSDHAYAIANYLNLSVDTNAK